MPTNNTQPNNISDFKLKASYWYVSHKLQLRQGLVIFLILFSVILYGYSIYRAGIILFVQEKDFQQSLNYLTSDLIDYSYFHEANKPSDIQILDFNSTDGRDSRYDFVALVKNSNFNFVATEVLFQLISAGEVVAEKTSFIYPNEEKYIVFFGQEVSNISNPVLKIANTGWRRYRNFEEYASPRLGFEVSDIDFKSAQEAGIRGELPISVLNFKITNNTAYSYWQVGVNMVLSAGQKVVGANYTSLDQFRSGETRDIEMRWYEPLPSISQIKILPEVDILNSDSLMPVD